MAGLQLLLAAGILVAIGLALASAVLAGYKLARRAAAPQRGALRLVSELTPDGLKQRPPANPDRLAQAALTRIWSLTDPIIARQRQLLEQNGELQRRYGQARALIDLMAEFNETMQLTAVLDRLSSGLSRFFAGDGVAIWVRAPQGQFELAAKVAANFPASLSPHDRWVATVMAGDAGLLLPPTWLEREMPCMAAPLLDAHGQRIGIVALTSRLRPAYTVEDGAFLRTVIGHAAMAIQNATMYQFIDTLSRIDALTGLNNRREFDRILAQEITRGQQSGQPFSLIVIDIDHFKQINDKYGHQEGDRTLQQVARLIQVVPKRATDAAFRTGGEEFAILMGDTDKAGAVSLSETLRGVAERAEFLGPGQPVTLSLGVATFPEDAGESVGLMAAADRALYQAKRGGRNRVQAA
ncbi:MAG TPA: sensor domain-containing diguanylate cyclase [Candidatus Dormibacteraeota bacterium]|nr:sensor domain-containing diguanylate cyclase [Candidatus Dormibacteraeota bacterium]